MQLLHVEKVYLSDGSVIEDCDCATHDSGFLIIDNQDHAAFDWYSIGQSVLKLEGVTVGKHKLRKRSHRLTGSGTGQANDIGGAPQNRGPLSQGTGGLI